MRSRSPAPPPTPSATPSTTSRSACSAATSRTGSAASPCRWRPAASIRSASTRLGQVRGGRARRFFHRFYFRTECTASRTSRRPSAAHLQPLRPVPIHGMLIGAAMFLDAEPPRFIRAWSRSGRRPCPSSAPLSRASARSSAAGERAPPPRAGGGARGLPRGGARISKPFTVATS